MKEVSLASKKETMVGLFRKTFKERLSEPRNIIEMNFRERQMQSRSLVLLRNEVISGSTYNSFKYSI